MPLPLLVPLQYQLMLQLGKTMKVESSMDVTILKILMLITLLSLLDMELMINLGTSG
jgi:hypothetical protein